MYLDESLAILRERGYTWGVAACLSGLAGVASAQDQAERAVRLFGAVEALRETVPAAVAHVHQVEQARDMCAARAQLDARAFTAAWTEGQAMTLEQAIAYALEATGPQ